MQLYTIPDIQGTNAAVQLSTVNPATNPTKARFFVFCSQGGQAAIGDSNVAAARGAHLTASASFVYPVPNVADPTVTYDISKIWAYVPAGTTLTITYGY